MKLEFKIKRFKELSAEEIYQILQLRSEVFVVEQNCVYLDPDGKDFRAIHVMGYSENEFAAYTRIFDAGDYFEEASIGRVLVSPRFRDQKLGHELMIESISQVLKCYNQTKIKIGAQLYLEKFYQSHGFITISDVFLEDGIEHIFMMKEN
jgi:ElaA protein